MTEANTTCPNAAAAAASKPCSQANTNRNPAVEADQQEADSAAPTQCPQAAAKAAAAAANKEKKCCEGGQCS